MTIIGRAIGSDGKPIGNSKIDMAVRLPASTKFEEWKTDALGTFEATFDRRDVAEGSWLGLDELPDQPPQLFVRIPLDRHVADLGDLHLDGRRFMERLDDRAAEDLLRTWCAEDRTPAYVEFLAADLLRRSPERWVPILSSLWQNRNRNGSDPPILGDLELLTVLRRLQKQPDPLRVELLGQGPIVVQAPGNCELSVRIANRDALGATFQMTRGGDYRSGRLERWTIEAVDSTGRRAPPAEFDSVMGGGMSQDLPLAPGEAVGAVLNFHHYVGPLVPGDYRLRVLYHDTRCITAPGNHNWLVVSTSDEIPLRVTPRKVVLTHGDRAALRAQIAELPPGPVLLLVAGSAGQSHRIASPRSPAEHLLAAGWQAVPVLIETLDDRDTSTGTRAWALALLYDITGLVCPESEPDAIASATLVSLPFSTGSDVHVTGGSGSRTSPTAPDRAAQDKLIAKWRNLKSLAEVVGQ